MALRSLCLRCVRMFDPAKLWNEVFRGRISMVPSSSLRRRGDLTDPNAWERTWRRSHRTFRSSFLKRRFVEDHHDVLRTFFGRATGARSVSLQVLELGCAPGSMLAAMANVAPQHVYSGVDFARAGLERADRALAARNLYPQLHLGDVREFAPVGVYDLVVSFGLLEHFDDPHEILSHHVRLVRPGGFVALTIPNYKHPFLKSALQAFSPDTLRTHNLETMNMDRMSGLFRSVGLSDVEVGSYGGAVIPGGRVSDRWFGQAFRVAATMWNVTFRSLPRRISPWQGYLWAMGRRPA